MNAEPAISKANMRTNHARELDNRKRLSRALQLSLPVVRVVWLAWALVLVSVFAYSLPLRYSEVVNSAHLQEGLRQIGMSPQFYAAYTVGLEVLFALVFFVVGTTIYLRKSSDWMALYVSFSLVTFGVGAAPLLHVLSALTRANPVWEMPQIFLAFLAWSLLHIFTYIFPDGRFVPRWTAFAAIVTELLLVPWFLLPVDSPLNPWSWPPALVVLIILAVALTPAATQIYRYITSKDSTYRQQIKWVVLGLTSAVLGSVTALLPLIDPALKPAITGTTLRQSEPTMLIIYQMAGTTVFCLAAMLLPVTLCISILRYRLWAIDVLIGRTLVYIPLTGILGGMYAASIALFQRVFVTLTGNTSDGAVVISTLILAAMFTPVKNGLQSIVDRRFKETPDPTKKLREFGSQVQSVVDVMDTKILTSKLLEEVVAAFDAQGGGIYTGGNGYMRLEHSTEDWTGEGALTMPLTYKGTRVGLLALGPRKRGQSYSRKDLQMLQGTLDATAELLVLQGATSTITPERG